LTGLPPAEAVRELARSRAVLQERLGLPIRAFAYPYGDCDPALAHLVGACGYTHALALGDTPCNQRDSPLLLPRIQILSETSLERFGRTLE
jgi:peptidoglycan/xylan/chitin deacetylase (PgdA/CDA1 family)